jgi:hypothetical protein
VAEHVLGQCLGGRVEPVGAAFEGARMEAVDGAGATPGLTAFARRPSAPAPVIAAPGESPAPAPVRDGEGGPAASPPPPADAIIAPS